MVLDGVHLDETSYWARWADWQARAKQRSVTAIDDGSAATPAMFVSNEVIVGHRDSEAIDRLVREGGVVQPVPALAAPPEELDMRREVEGFPLPVTIRFENPPDVEAPLQRLARAYDDRVLETRPPLTFTSEPGARVAALVAELQADGHDADLNWLGTPDALPLTSATESWASNDPFTWPSHAGRSRIVDAWQLVEAYRAQRSLKPVVWIAVLDGGFWLANGSSASGDLPGFGLDLANDSVASAGGANANTCGNGACPWHGNGVASAAAAAADNSVGVAGAGGTVARMVFFKTTISVDETIKCLRYCTAWGLDVLNMSFTMRRVEMFFGTSSWNESFQFAIDHGVIPVASAGNGDSDQVGQELPDYNVRPATRTPGTITVGALDQADQAAGFSNYGSSVNIWAPGTSIPTGPDPANAGGSSASGTSQAAPLVAGVVAMMRAVNPGINATSARDLITSTGWAGKGRVTKGLDAYAAVLAAMGGHLPADLSEANNAPSTARMLTRAAVGGPLRTADEINTIGPGDPDHYRFTVDSLSSLTITLESYRRLGGLSIRVIADAEDTRPSVEALTTTYGPGRATVTGVLPRGEYLVAISGNRPNAYTLAVNDQPLVLAGDQFEPNDSFEQASRMRLKALAAGATYLLGWGPGRYDCTLHTIAGGTISPDFYELHTPPRPLLQLPYVRVESLDAPVDVRLYDGARVETASWVQVREVRFAPADDSVSYLQIDGASQTRYVMALGLELDRDAVPDPVQEPYEPIPGWWDGPWEGRVHGPHRYFSVEVEPREVGGRELAFEANPALRITLFDLQGNAVREGVRSDDRLTISTDGLDQGHYLIMAAATAAAAPALLRSVRPGR